MPEIYQCEWDDNSYLLYQEHQYLLSRTIIVSDPGDEVEHIYATI